MRRGAAAAAVALLGVLAVGLLPAAPSQADPVFPSQEEVEAAEQAATGKAGEVEAASAQVAVAAEQAASAQAELSRAAEDYNEARIALERRTREAGLARSAAADAAADLVQARRDVGEVAAQTYRDGGVSTLAVLLSADGPDQVLARASLLTAVGDGERRTMKKVDSRRLVAEALRQRADQAVSVQEDAAAALEAAKEAAQRASRRAEAAVAVVRQRQAELATQLAALQATSERVSTQRREGLEVQRQAREEAGRRAAEQRAREAAARAAREQAERDQAERERAERERAGRERTQPDRTSGRSTPSRSGGSGGSGSSGTGGTSSVPSGSSRGSASGGVAAVAWARTQVGKPYLWGADGPDSYDCSGLTLRAWERAGVYLPHSSRAQYRQVRKVPYSQLRVGDLVFWGDDPGDPGSIHHVALYAGGDMIVEAPATGLDVRVVPMRRRGAMPYAGRP